ncbi:MAG: serine hydrolase domain-containing protein [Sphingomicrobium sp.]
MGITAALLLGLLPLSNTLAAASPLASAATAAPLDEMSAQLVADIDRQLTDEAAKGFGGAVIIKRGDSVVLAKGYGYANREAKIRFTPETIAQIASVTKSQTAAVIATLIAERKISLGDRVSKFVPAAPEPGRSRTITQLLTHSSGLADTCTGDFERQSEAMLVRACLSKPLAFPVGEDNYSNLGYSVLALIIQRVTGKSWESAVRERVWRPLHMNNIDVLFRGRTQTSFARGYEGNRARPLLSQSIKALRGDDWALRGNGSFMASSTTMIQFLDGLLDRRSAFPEAARRMMLQPVVGQGGKTQEGFGLVFRYDDQGKLVRVGHSGSDGAFYNYLGWLPGNDVRFYFVGNNGADDAQRALGMALRGALRLPASAANRT